MATTRMNYLIDTHILIWYGEGNPRLDSSILAEMRKPSNRVYVSHATFWEMTIKLALGKLEFSTPVPGFQNLIPAYNFRVMGFDFEHYKSLELLPPYHKDPFDRMLIAQAIAEDFTIITHDKRFAAYEPMVRILWN